MNLDPRILQALLGQLATGNSNGQVQEYIDPTTGLPYTLLRNYAQGTGDAGTVDRSQLMSGEIVSPAGQKNQFGYDLNNVYDQQGNFARQDDDGAGFGAFGDFVGDNMGAILAAIATAGVASAAGAGMGAAEAGAAGAAEAGAGGWADWAASELAGAASNPATASALDAWAATSAIPGAGSTLFPGASMPGAAPPGTGPSSPGAPSAPTTQGPGAPNPGGPNWSDWAQQQLREAATNPATAEQLSRWSSNSNLPYNANSGGWLDWLTKPSNLARLAGAAAGAYGSRDDTQTSSKEPWGPSQGWLKDLIGQGQQLSQQYQAEPFSPLQRQAYGNQFGLLNAANQAAPGLLAGMQANASGANAYDRTNPRRSLLGSTPQFQWTPGLLSPTFGG